MVRSQPGLISLETLSDVNDHHKYVVLSEVRQDIGGAGGLGVRAFDGVLLLLLLLQWKSLKDYQAWTSSEAHRKCTEQINEVLDVPGKRTTIYKRPEEDIFLL